MQSHHRNKHQTPNIDLKGLNTRISSSIVLVILLIGYHAIGIIASEGPTWKLDVDPLAANYAFSALSCLICLVVTGELLWAFKIRRWWEMLILLSSVLLLLVFPMMKPNYDLPIYNHWKINSWFVWWQDLIILAVFFFAFGMIGHYSAHPKSFSQGLLLGFVSLMFVLALKAVDNVTLSMIGNHPKYGFVTLIWIWATIILTDIFSYFGGSFWGRRKLAPHISPNKTWEGTFSGCTAGIIGGLLLSLLPFYLVSGHIYGPFAITLNNLAINQGAALPGVFLGVMTVVITILGQLGDLFFSALKRKAKVKDFSNLIPGHGGLLDRLDSFIFVFFFFFFITLFI